MREYIRQIAIGYAHGAYDLLKNLVEREIRFARDDQLFFSATTSTEGSRAERL